MVSGHDALSGRTRTKDRTMTNIFKTPAGMAQSVDPAPVGLDAVVPFQVDALDARGRAVLLGDALDVILSRHDYPEPVARLLGEMTVLTVLLGSSLKFDGRFIVQTQTNGPVSLLVVDFATAGTVRAYAKFDAEKVAAAQAAGKALPEDLLGPGTLALTVDQGAYMQRYQGVVALDGASLEEIARNYFRQSEQIPTEVRLAVGRLSTRSENGRMQQRWRAGGIVAQFLPDSPDRMRVADLHPGEAPEGAVIHELEDDDAWAEVKALLGTVEDDELIDESVGVHTLLFRLFHERGVRVNDAQPIAEKCTCSRDKVAAVLDTLSAADKAEAEKNGVITITCEFCSTVYEFPTDQTGRDKE